LEGFLGFSSFSAIAFLSLVVEILSLITLSTIRPSTIRGNGLLVCSSTKILVIEMLVNSELKAF
jgi:hypothetical protein